MRKYDIPKLNLNKKISSKERAIMNIASLSSRAMKLEEPYKSKVNAVLDDLRNKINNNHKEVIRIYQYKDNFKPLLEEVTNHRVQW